MTLMAAKDATVDGLPKAARDLLALAEQQGWAFVVGHDLDTGGNPFVMLTLRRLAPDWEVKATWHSRATGGRSLRLFSLIWRHVPLQGWGHYWQDAPSLKAVREVVVGNAVVAPFVECRRHVGVPLWPVVAKRQNR